MENNPVPSEENVLLPESENNGRNEIPSDNILVRLNDDCIIQIFEYLPLRDLCNVADVCKAFDSNASSVFKRKHCDLVLDQLLLKRESMDSSYSSDSSCSSTDSLYRKKDTISYIGSLKAVSRLFRHFGVYIQTVHLNLEEDDLDDEILELLTTHCTGDDAKLKKLILSDVEIGEDTMPHLQSSLFDRLKCLEVVNSSFYIGSELSELFLEDVNMECCLPRKLEKLQTLYLHNVLENSRGAFKALLMSASQLKRLSISGEVVSTFWGDQMTITPELVELRLDVPIQYEEEKDLNSLARFKHLKVFSLNCKGVSITTLLDNFIEGNVPIEELCLSNLTIGPQTASNLSKLSKIEELQLSDFGWAENVQLSTIAEGMPILQKICLSDFGGRFSVDDIKSTIASAPKLKGFKLNYLIDYLQAAQKPELFDPLQINHQTHLFNLDTNNYNKICQLIRRRSHGPKLYLEVSGINCWLNVPECIVEKNRMWLEVKIVTYKKIESIDIIDYYGFSEDEDESETSNDDESVVIDD